MVELNIEAIRAEVRAMDFVRGTPGDVAEWRMANEDSRHNLVIENMIPTPNEDAFFELMLDEAIPPELTTQILLRLLDPPNADRMIGFTTANHAHP